jgi:hypothetical protein
MTISETVEAAADQSASRDPYSDRQSLEFRFRVRRFSGLRRLIEDVIAERGHCEILDLGGNETYWLIGEDFLAAHRSRLRITILNTEQQAIRDRGLFDFVRDSATGPALFAGRRFDLAHSNSVIEHVGDWGDMRSFAANVRRLAPRYFIQTPNYWFPYEPHFRFPGFQFLPEAARVALIRRFALGFFPRIEDAAEAQGVIDEHRLLSTRQVRTLFPEASIRHETVLGLRKSILAVRG